MELGGKGPEHQSTSGSRQKLRRYVPGVWAVVWFNLFVLVAAGLFAFWVERIELNSARQDQREAVTRRAALLASQFETEVNSAFYLVTGLASYLGIRGELTQEEYTRICRRMFLAKPELVNIAAAPGLVNRYVYPLKGNEMIVGLDYRNLPAQLPAVLSVMETREPLIAGPVQLVQGGEAIIGRIPVIDQRPGREGEFWGIISTPFRMEALYEQVGMPESIAGLDFALRGKDGTGAAGEVFWGEPELFHGDAVKFPVDLISGSWLLAMKPAEGWIGHSPYRNWIYSVTALLVLLLVTLSCLGAVHLRRLEIAHEREAEAQLAKERFFSNMSHEIRTPLNGISGLAEMIAESSDDEMGRESARIIHESSQTLTQLLGDVLVLSDMNYGQAKPSFESIDLKVLLCEVMAPLRPEIDRKQLKVVYGELPESCRVVRSDPVLLRQILWQLLANAVKFTEAGEVEVEVSTDAGDLCMEISDTGVGISQAYLDRIYDVFSQEDETHTRRFSGTGIGLAVVKRSVELLEGRVSVTSRKGEGSCFSVKLPLREKASG